MNHLVAPDFSFVRLHAGTALTILLACAVFFLPSLKAQQNAPQEVSTRTVEPTFKLQAERNMVTVRVVVRNGKGEVVDNLRQEDFQLFDRGKKQAIVKFSVEKPPIAVERNPAAGRPGSSEQPAPPGVIPNRFVGLFFDDMSTSFANLVQAREAAERYLAKSLQPGDRVGIFPSSGIKPLDFTSDLAKVHETVLALMPRPVVEFDSCAVVPPYEAYLLIEMKDPGAGAVITDELNLCGIPTAGPPSPIVPASTAVEMESRKSLAYAKLGSLGVLRGLDALVRRMASLPGQRSIVILSGGFLTETERNELDRVAERALRAMVVISAIDARGLYNVSLAADASRAALTFSNNPGLIAQKESLARTNAVRMADGMGTLAQATGGVFFENNNDLEAGLRQVTGLTAAYYLMAFSPEELKHDGAFHALKVTLVAGKGLNVQARKGYFAPAKNQDSAAQAKEELEEAVFSPSERQGLPIKVNTQFFMIDASDAEIGVVTHVDLQQIHFRKEADRNVHTLTFVTAVFDRDGHYVAGQQKVLELRLRDASLETFLRTGIKVKSDLKVKPGVYLLRSVVRDTESGQTSAVNRTIEIPF